MMERIQELLIKSFHMTNILNYPASRDLSYSHLFKASSTFLKKILILAILVVFFGQCSWIPWKNITLLTLSVPLGYFGLWTPPPHLLEFPVTLHGRYGYFREPKNGKTNAKRMYSLYFEKAYTYN